MYRQDRALQSPAPGFTTNEHYLTDTYCKMFGYQTPPSDDESTLIQQALACLSQGSSESHR